MYVGSEPTAIQQVIRLINVRNKNAHKIRQINVNCACNTNRSASLKVTTFEVAIT